MKRITDCLLLTLGCLVLGGMFVFGLATSSFAADYPERPVHLVVTFPPGGAADILARGISPKLSEQLGQPIVVDNRPGANGVIGFDLVAQSPADGYTLLLAFTTGVAINPLLAKVAYDPEKDFVPVSMLSRTPMTLVVGPSFPASSVRASRGRTSSSRSVGCMPTRRCSTLLSSSPGAG